jgi:hypothetical protein
VTRSAVAAGACREGTQEIDLGKELEIHKTNRNALKEQIEESR